MCARSLSSERRTLARPLPPTDGHACCDYFSSNLTYHRWLNNAFGPPPQKRQHTPEAVLTARLKGMVAPKGGGPWRLAVHILEKGRVEGIKDVKAYNVVLKARPRGVPASAEPAMAFASGGSFLDFVYTIGLPYNLCYDHVCSFGRWLLRLVRRRARE